MTEVPAGQTLSLPALARLDDDILLVFNSSTGPGDRRILAMGITPDGSPTGPSVRIGEARGGALAALEATGTFGFAGNQRGRLVVAELDRTGTVVEPLRAVGPTTRTLRPGLAVNRELTCLAWGAPGEMSAANVLAGDVPLQGHSPSCAESFLDPASMLVLSVDGTEVVAHRAADDGSVAVVGRYPMGIPAFPAREGLIVHALPGREELTYVTGYDQDDGATAAIVLPGYWWPSSFTGRDLHDVAAAIDPSAGWVLSALSSVERSGTPLSNIIPTSVVHPRRVGTGAGFELPEGSVSPPDLAAVSTDVSGSFLVVATWNSPMASRIYAARIRCELIEP